MSSTTAQVLIPLMRRVMPTIIANQIIGVSPLRAPTGNIFAPPPGRKRRWPVAPEFYRHFLRVNNRRRTQDSHDLLEAGYWSVLSPTPSASYRDCDEWCRQQFGQHTWCRFPGSAMWWFSREADALLFRMVWCDPHD